MLILMLWSWYQKLVLMLLIWLWSQYPVLIMLMWLKSQHFVLMMMMLFQIFYVDDDDDVQHLYADNAYDDITFIDDVALALTC